MKNYPVGNELKNSASKCVCVLFFLLLFCLFKCELTGYVETLTRVIEAILKNLSAKCGKWNECGRLVLQLSN